MVEFSTSLIFTQAILKFGNIFEWNCNLKLTKELKSLGLGQSFNLEQQTSKGLIRLALTDPQELQETSHAKSYGVETSTKYTEYLSQYKMALPF